MAKKSTTNKEAETKKTAPKKQDLILDPSKEYTIEATAKGGFLKKGGIYKVTGEIASILIKKGSAIIKE